MPTYNGRFTRVGNATKFGVNEGIPFGLAWDGSKFYMVGSSLDALYELNRTTGVATRIGNATNFGVNETIPKGLAWDGERLLMLGSSRNALYELNRTTGVATQIGNATNFGLNLGDPEGLAWDGEKLYMVDSDSDALYELHPTTGVATRIGTAFRFGISEINPTGLAWDGERLLMLGQWNRRLYDLNRTTGVATFIGTLSLTTVGETSPEGLAFDGTDLFMVGSRLDALFIAIQEVSYTPPPVQSVTEGEDYTLDLSTLYKGATSYALQGTNETYVSITGSVVSFTAPSVNADTDIMLNVRGSNSSSNSDQSITVTIINKTPPVFVAPVGEEVRENQPYFLDLITVFTDATSYTLEGTNPPYVALIGSRVEFVAPFLNADTDIIINVRGTNDEGSTDGAFTVSILDDPALEGGFSMGKLVLIDDEAEQIRMLVGLQVTEIQLTKEQIESDVVLGSATDYVFEKIREDMVSPLEYPDVWRSILDGAGNRVYSDQDIEYAVRFPDETDDDVGNFVNNVLRPPQRQQLRRAVLFRAAGLCMPIVDRIISETAGKTTQRHAPRDWISVQENLFLSCDEEIVRLRNAFPNDVFIDTEDAATSPQSRASYVLFRAM